MSFNDGRDDGNETEDRFGSSDPYARYLREFEVWRRRALQSGGGPSLDRGGAGRAGDARVNVVSDTA